jgi:hypothetical protein
MLTATRAATRRQRFLGEDEPRNVREVVHPGPLKHQPDKVLTPPRVKAFDLLHERAMSCRAGAGDVVEDVLHEHGRRQVSSPPDDLLLR